MMKVKYYRCPICKKPFKTLNGWGTHMDTTHPNVIPEDYSYSRYFYFTVTGKTHGVCRTCKGDTPWNEDSQKYDQYCTNPECKKAYAKIAKQRMIGKYGKVYLLNNPDVQRKMMKNRKISGTYKFEDGQEFEYVGSYEKKFLEMLNTMFEWHSNDLMAPSPHTYYYNYKNPKDDPKNEGLKFYIPDFYIPSLNLEIEIKQSTSTNKKFNEIMRVKEHAKDELMKSNKEVNYIKINDNNFEEFYDFLIKAKEYVPTPEENKKSQVDLVMESFSPYWKDPDAEIATEAFSNSEDMFNDIVEFNDRLNKMDYLINIGSRIIREIKSDDMQKYHLSTPKEFEDNNGGVCWDYVANEAKYFKEHYPKVKFKTYYFVTDDGECCPTHTFLLFFMNGKCYWFESSWKDHVGIYEFNNEKDALNYISKELTSGIDETKINAQYLTEFNALNKKMYGMSVSEFMDYAIGDCDTPYKFSKSSVNPLSRLNADFLKDIQHIANEHAQYSRVNKYPVYIILMHSGTPLANIIQKFTKDDFSHACISFNSKLDPMYSFGGKTGDEKGTGFVIQDPKVSFYKTHKAYFHVYVMYVDKIGYTRMQKRMQYFIDNEDDLHYDMKNLLSVFVGRASEKSPKYFCSRFCMSVINSGHDEGMPASLWKPQDMANLEDITLVNAGDDFYQYDYKITEKNLKKIKKNNFDEIAFEASLTKYGYKGRHYISDKNDVSGAIEEEMQYKKIDDAILAYIRHKEVTGTRYKVGDIDKVFHYTINPEDEEMSAILTGGINVYFNHEDSHEFDWEWTYSEDGFKDEIAQEGLLSFLVKDRNDNDVQSWREKLFSKKSFLGIDLSSLIDKTGVSVKEGTIEFHGINFTTLRNRINKFYQDKNIFNIFNPRYNTLSYRKFKKKRIQRKDIKIDYLYAPEFFALELITLFQELGKRFRDSQYIAISKKLYEMSWVSEADKNTECTPCLDTRRLSNLTLTLNSYQVEFIEKYPKLKSQLNLTGYILAFEQGLGKTLTAIGLSECLNKDHVYIVCPNSLKENWVLEIKKYYAKYEDDDLWRQEVFICSDKAILFNKNTTKFIITNNESIEKMLPYVMGGNNILILDESHNFRNIKSKRVTQLINLRDKLRCKDSLIMSGTPIKATPDEITPALMMIDPTFTDEAAKMFSKAFKIHEALGTSLVQARFGKIMYRKEKDVLENKLPEKIVSELPVTITGSEKYIFNNVKEVVLKRKAEIVLAEQDEFKAAKKPFYQLVFEYSPASSQEKDEFRKCADAMAGGMELHEIDKMYIENFMKEVKSCIKDKKDRDDLKYLETHYMRFQAHCLGVAMGEIFPPYRRDMFIEMYKQNTDKFYDMINKSVKKTIIFSQFKGVVEYVYNDLNDNGIGSVMITGDVKNRMEILQEFKNNDNVRVLLATSQTLGTGVTLVEANQMFFFGPPWRKGDFDQCSDRIHRIGQTDDVYIYTVTLNTGDALNLSTRMDNILNWSGEMFNSFIHTTKDDEDLDKTNFETLVKASESSFNCSAALEALKRPAKRTLYNFTKKDGLQIEDYIAKKDKQLYGEFVLADPDDSTKLNVFKEISEKDLPRVIEIEQFFHGITAKAKIFIPEGYCLQTGAVISKDGLFKNMKFTDLGMAVFSSIADNQKSANVKFVYREELGRECWDIITTRKIRKGTKLACSPKEEIPSFADEHRL